MDLPHSVAHAHKYTVPLFLESMATDAFPDRTEILLQLDDRYFIVSASHDMAAAVADGKTLLASTPDCVIVEHAQRGPETVKIMPVNVFHNDHDVADVAILELHIDTVTALKTTKKFLKAGECVALNRRFPGEVILVGHPTFLAGPAQNTKDDELSHVPLAVLATTQLHHGR